MKAEALGALLDLMKDGTINGKIAKEVFEAMVETGRDPAAIVDERGLRQVTDTGAIDAAVEAVIDVLSSEVQQIAPGTPVSLTLTAGAPALPGDGLDRDFADARHG